METIGDLFGELFSVWKEMTSAFFAVLPKALHVILWFATGLLIIPCVFVAGTLYPMWEEWGKEF